MNFRGSLLVPIVLMVAAPVIVAGNLLRYGSVWTSVIAYHLVICLLLPWLDTVLINRGSWRDHLQLVGLLGSGQRSAVQAGLRSPGQGSAIGVGLLVGLVTGGLVVAGSLLWGESLWDDSRIAATLARRGVSATEMVVLSIYMVVCNGACEELFWRGYIHGHLSRLDNRVLAVGICSLFYTSYHVVSAYLLFGGLLAIASLTLLVFVAGSFWGWLRERHRSVWPALLGHSGATAGYMTVYWLQVA